MDFETVRKLYPDTDKYPDDAIKAFIASNSNQQSAPQQQSSGIDFDTVRKMYPDEKKYPDDAIRAFVAAQNQQSQPHESVNALGNIGDTVQQLASGFNKPIGELGGALGNLKQLAPSDGIADKLQAAGHPYLAALQNIANYTDPLSALGSAGAAIKDFVDKHNTNPSSLMDKALQAAGGGIASMLPWTGGFGLAAKAAPLTSEATGILGDMVAPYMSHPISQAVSDLGAGAGMGLAGQAVANNTDTNTPTGKALQFGAEMLGGGLGGMATGVLPQFYYKYLSPSGLALRAVTNGGNPIPPEVTGLVSKLGENNAIKNIQDAAEKYAPDITRRAQLAQDIGLQPSFAELTNSPELLNSQQYLTDRMTGSQLANEISRKESNNATFQDYFRNLIGNSVIDPETIGQNIREELENAKSSVISKYNDLANELGIHSNSKIINIGNIKDDISNYIQDTLNSFEKKNIPSAIKDFLGFGDKTTLNNLTGFRQALSDTIRDTDDSSVKRVASNVKNILDKSVQNSDEIPNGIRDFYINYGKDVHEKFDKGVIGQILKTNGKGEYTTNPYDLIMSNKAGSLFNPNTPYKIDDLQNALGDKASDLLQQGILSKVLNSSLTEDGINPEIFNNKISKHYSILSQLPEVRDYLKNLGSTLSDVNAMVSPATTISTLAKPTGQTGLEETTGVGIPSIASSILQMQKMRLNPLYVAAQIGSKMGKNIYQKGYMEGAQKYLFDPTAVRQMQQYALGEMVPKGVLSSLIPDLGLKQRATQAAVYNLLQSLQQQNQKVQ